jgi:hypothetical protein
MIMGLNRLIGGGLLALLICTVMISGCTGPKDQTQIINTGTPNPDLVTDMHYRPIDLPLRSNSIIPAGLDISNLTVGILNDGTLLFQGMISNTQKEAVPGYTIVYLELLGNDSAPVAMSPPLVSERNLPGGGKFPYFYITPEPLKENITAYRMIVQISNSYPGV